MPFDLITRSEWEALPAKDPIPNLDLPVSYVSLSYVTSDADVAGPETIRHLQRRDMFRGMADIQPNFLIAGDGKVYEGRGWGLEPGNRNGYPGKEGKFLELTYLGDYNDAEPNHPVYLSTGMLLEIGVRNNYVLKTATFLTEDLLLDSQQKPQNIVQSQNLSLT